MEETLLRYYALTVPHVTIFVGTLFGLLLIMGVDIRLAAGIFSLLYGLMLTIIALIVREHFGGLWLYKISLASFLLLTAFGAIIVLKYLPF
ncbi:hypothetical protein [Pyrococcus yayanosii]|uniref:Uncharacterized protein n=1 Tax=Pyrococcus yayanosii (strain CH1 / JCM 16557) TaxID=529709 RepID=F8AIE2_PYRYC|nr:hypothetical protein [Pyrococcus yayanosii]AEH25545.1 hypothetical protein PYCH_18900 [Pyrococcus yayanosii CH1]